MHSNRKLVVTLGTLGSLQLESPWPWMEFGVPHSSREVDEAQAAQNSDRVRSPVSYSAGIHSHSSSITRTFLLETGAQHDHIRVAMCSSTTAHST